MPRLALSVHGVVQGVGFRPFVQREAKRRGLSGWVRNGNEAVELEIEGASDALDAFVATLRLSPAPIVVQELAIRELCCEQSSEFSILPSRTQGSIELTLPPDLAICDECRSEIRDPAARRFRYPFTNCTRCGPRYSIVLGLPYDRERTTLRTFPLCRDCRDEYESIWDRRFHAEPIACPACGPRLFLAAADGSRLADGDAALGAAAEALRAGAIVALKGIGGYQLLAAATSSAAVRALRARKHREEKPFAVMFPDLAAARRYCRLTPTDEATLEGPAAPIVLLPQLEGHDLAPEIAPSNPNLGVFLAYSPLHVLLLDEYGGPLVCTSGNPSSEPLCTEDAEAFAKLGGIADRFLAHDRPIARALDDSVVRGGPRGLEVLRRARGFAPRPVAKLAEERTILALGAHLKSTVALLSRGQLFSSQHLGDLESEAAHELLERTVEELLTFFGVEPDAIACDRHPDYASSVLAERLSARFGVPLFRIQHHAAHVAAVACEHGLRGSFLGFAWDGMGLGMDGQSWGGEALLCERGTVRRVAHVEQFPLPGGDRAAREPRRSALGLLSRFAPEAARRHAARAFDAHEADGLLRALERGLGAPETTSVGRVFDAVASLLGVRDRCSFEGQAAMGLEFLALRGGREPGYPLPLAEGQPLRAELGPLIQALLADLDRSEQPARIAARFHAAWAGHACEVARRVGEGRVVLSGGCFQNTILARDVRRALERAGFEVYSARSLPTNDGGISAGQIARVSAGAPSGHEMAELC